MKNNLLWKPLVGAVTLIGMPAFAGTITAEKSCAVRVEGEDFAAGQKFNVYKGDDHAKSIATIQISKVDAKDPKKAVGKVVSPKMKSCAALKGMQVALAEEGAETPAADAAAEPAAKGEKKNAKTSLPKVDFYVNSGLLITATTGVHVKSPEIAAVPMQLINVDVGLDVFPVQFAGTGFIHKAIGLGFKYRWGRSAQDIDVQTASAIAKQQTAPSDINVDFIFRIPYSKDSLATELRAGYVTHALTHKLTKTTDDLTTSPMRNTSYKGFAVGLMQRVALGKMIRLSLGLNYGIVSGTMASAVDDNIEQSTVIVKPSALYIKFGTDIKLGTFKVGLVYDRSSYKGAATTTYVTSPEATTASYTTSETYDSIALGLGLLL